MPTRFEVFPVTLGRQGVAKQILLGFRDADAEIGYLRAFIDLAQAGRVLARC